MIATAMLASGCVHYDGPDLGPGDFSGSSSWGHVLALSQAGSRAPGSVGSAKARRYIEMSLRRAGVSELREVAFSLDPSGRAVHLLGALPGASEDILVLAAPYDTAATEPPGSVDALRSVSGAALVLELGRALSERHQPFTLWLVFLDAEARPAGVDPSRHRFHGSEHWAEVLTSSGALDRVRAMFYFDDVADPAHPVARDMRSHGIYRDIFFETAEEQGHEREFPRVGNARSPHGGHRVLLGRGVRRVVAIVGGPPVAPGSSEPAASVSTAPETLSAVGQVSVEAIDRIARQLEKVDAFVAPPENAHPQAAGSFEAKTESK